MFDRGTATTIRKAGAGPRCPEAGRKAAQQEPAAARNVVEKSYLVLGALPVDGDWIGASEVARNTGLPKSTVHRLLGVLADLRLADRQAAGYRLGPRMLNLARQASGGRALALRDLLLPHLLDLFQATGLAVHLGVEHEHGVLCLEHLHGHRGLPLPIRTGSVLPRHTTAMGKVLAAHSDETGDELPARLRAELARIRRDGIAVNLGGPARNVTSLAIPVWDSARTVAAVIAVAGPSHTVDVQAASRQLRRAAHAAARELAAGGVIGPVCR